MPWWWIQLSNQKCNKGSQSIISLLQSICGSWTQHCATCPQAIILKLQMINFMKWDLITLHQEYWKIRLERWIYKKWEQYNFKNPPIILHLDKLWMLNQSLISNKMCHLKNFNSPHSLLEVLRNRILMAIT